MSGDLASPTRSQHIYNCLLGWPGLRWRTARKKAEMRRGSEPRSHSCCTKSAERGVGGGAVRRLGVRRVLIYHVFNPDLMNYSARRYLLCLSPKTSALPACLPGPAHAPSCHRKLLVCSCPVGSVTFNPLPLSLFPSLGLEAYEERDCVTVSRSGPYIDF